MTQNQNNQSRDEGRQDPNKQPEKKRSLFDKGKKHMKKPIIDSKNDLVYDNKHWKPIDELNPAHVDKVIEGKSPLTKMQEEQVCEGVIHLSGTFLMKHREEIVGAIEHSEKIASERDPLDKIINIETSPEKITIYTAKNQLARAIAKKLDHSYKGGALETKWSKGEKVVEIYWHKDNV